MKLYLRAPQKALWDWVLNQVGNQPCWVIVPSGTPPLDLPTGFEQTDIRALLARHCSEPQALEISPDHLACMAQVCEQVLNDASYFGRVRHLPGFHRQLVQRFTEWHLEGLNPNRLSEGAEAVLTNPPDTLSEPDLQEEWRQKTTELVELWQRWRVALDEQNLLEPAQIWWQVIDQLRRGSADISRPCVWLGFTRLRQVELTLLKVLEVYTTQHFALLCDPERPDLFRPTLKLYDELRQAIPCEEQRQITLAVGTPDPLTALERGLWSPMPPPPANWQGIPITILDVPNPLMEMETVAREILQLSEEDYTYSDMAILLRQPASAIEMLEVIFERYGIPFTGEVSLPLTRSRAVAWLMQGLRLFVGQERWHAWVDWFRHPIFGFTPLQLRQLENLRGVASLSDAIQKYSQKYPDEGAPLQWLQFCRDLQARLSTEFYEVIRELASKITPHDAPDTIESDDLKVLLQLAKAYQREVRPLPPAQALAYLERLVARSSYSQRWNRLGVRLLNPEHADLVGAKVVFVIGVLEGVYPYRHPDEPFLRETERLALCEQLQPPPNLPTRTELQAGEPLRFYRALTTAGERLYLSYPRTQNDSDALPSFYLKAVESALAQPIPIRTLTLDQIVPEPDECRHPYDRTLSEMAEPYTEP
ncbi:MAG: 3'-5' exonuclease, partial [Fimbriimonadales bacterium]